MFISWLGQSCFKIQSKDLTIAIDPFDKTIGLRVPSFQADIALSTHDHFDHNNLSAIKGSPYIINTPGEYEIKNVFVFGIPSWHDEQQGALRGPNTIYVIKTENLTIAHLGDLGQPNLTEEQSEQIGSIDILMIPVGGNYTIDGKQAVDVINQIEPRIIIPMHYKIPELKLDIENLEKFLKEIGIKPEEPEEKIRIVKKDLPTEETKIIILKN